MIVNISNPAKDELNKILNMYNIENKSVRIFIREISPWYGPMFSLALDEPTHNDVTYQADEFTILLNDDLSDKISVINIYYKSALSSDIFRVSTDLVWKEEYYGLPWARPW